MGPIAELVMNGANAGRDTLTYDIGYTMAFWRAQLAEMADIPSRAYRKAQMAKIRRHRIAEGVFA